ncbi:hypothetical protein DLAC_08599 [Tieghemostelium lacteum]|uniref:EGF-like domain-containing protein n=1 Tax=Tieghemostelium lacteum TaxID=361077 RepID=A0A151Z7T8_TIELA|nr:hypothetical protein DLAC_08599 [Tieghemostelium lacteum]|eukprot:KYQ90021.1 hypothetical protein DLAC_08599 [Tieghemostelium lacteum]
MYNYIVILILLISTLNLNDAVFEIVDLSDPIEQLSYVGDDGFCRIPYRFKVLGWNYPTDVGYCRIWSSSAIIGNYGAVDIFALSEGYNFGYITKVQPNDYGDVWVRGNIYSGVLTTLSLTKYSCVPIPYPLQELVPTDNSRVFRGPINTKNEYTIDLIFNLTKRANFTVYTNPPYYCYHYMKDIQTMTLVCGLNSNPPNYTPDPYIHLTITDTLKNNNYFNISTFLTNDQRTPDVSVQKFYTSDISPKIPYSIRNLYYMVTIENYKDGIFYAGVSDQSGRRDSYIVYGNNIKTVMLHSYEYDISKSIEYSTIYNHQQSLIQDTNSISQYSVISKISNNMTVISDNFYNITSLNLYSFQAQIGYLNKNEATLTVDVWEGPTVQIELSMIGGTYANGIYDFSFLVGIYHMKLKFFTGLTYEILKDKYDEEKPKWVNLRVIPLTGMRMILQGETYDGAFSPIQSIQMGDILVKPHDRTVFDYVTYYDDDGVVSYEIYVDYSRMNLRTRTYYIRDVNLYNNTQDMVYSTTKNFLRYPKVILDQQDYGNPYAGIEISELRFDMNNVDLTFIECKNSLYVNFTNSDREMVIRLILNPRDPYPKVFYGHWNETEELFTVEFVLPTAMYSGPVHYQVYYPDLTFDSLDMDYPLIVRSDYADQMPPLISKIVAFPSGVNQNVQVQTNMSIGWTFTIVDPINGIQSGLIKVTSNLGVFEYTYKFTIDPTSEFNYTVEIPIQSQCTSQTYYISYIELMDKNGYISRFDPGNSTKHHYISPLLYIMNNQTDQLGISIECASHTDTTPPIVTNFETNVNSIDTSRYERDLIVTFTVQDDTSVSRLNLPKCKISAVPLDQYFVQAKFLNGTNTTATFQCSTNLPLGFGSIDTKIIVSLQGYTDIYSNLGGISTIDLINGGWNPVINVTYSKDTPMITDALVHNNNNGIVSIFGRNFINTTSVLVTHQNSSVSTFAPIYVNSLYLVIQGISSSGMVLDLRVKNSNGMVSNAYRVNIVPVKYPIPPPCPGTPVCGGPSNGQCSTTLGCVCIDPWFGVDCLSQIIPITPNISTSSPTLENDYSTTIDTGITVTLKSLVSVRSLVELTFDGTIVNTHNLNEWIYTNTTQLSTPNIQEYSYKSNFTHQGRITNVTVLVQYFLQKTPVSFASAKFDMMPSTMKYKIELSSYSFSSTFNSIQLQMPVSIKMDQEVDTCSNSDSGKINSKSDYLKLQINGYSLYTRLINLGIIDNKVHLITNQFSDDNSSDSSSSESSKIIGINIPYYDHFVQLDPDFSMLFEAVNAGDLPNAICYSLAKGRLTTGQIIGIAIAGVFLIAVIIAFLYVRHLKEQERKHFTFIQEKIKSLMNP